MEISLLIKLFLLFQYHIIGANVMSAYFSSKLAKK